MELKNILKLQLSCSFCSCKSPPRAPLSSKPTSCSKSRTINWQITSAFGFNKLLFYDSQTHNCCHVVMLPCCHVVILSCCHVVHGAMMSWCHVVMLPCCQLLSGCHGVMVSCCHTMWNENIWNYYLVASVLGTPRVQGNSQPISITELNFNWINDALSSWG